MIHQQTLIHTTVHGGNRNDEADTRLHGRWLVLARVICIVLIAYTLGFFATGLVIAFAQHRAICTGLTCVLTIPEALIYFAVAALIFWHKSDEWMALEVGLMLVLLAPLSTLPNEILNLLDSIPVMQVLLGVSTYLAFASFLLFCFLFPNGRFVPRWAPWVVAGYLFWFAGLLLVLFWPPSWLNSDAAWLLLVILPIASLPLIVMLVQIYRYQNVSGSREREQSRWAMIGMSVALWGFFVSFLASYSLSTAILLLIPLSIGIAVLRYRLYNIDVLINRTFIYGTLTGILALVYFSLVFALQFLLRGLISQTNNVSIVISTLAVAVLFQPLRRRIQQIIDRRFYRRKYDAVRTLAAFSETLRNEVDLEQLQKEMVAVVQETMQPRHVSLWLRKPNRK